MLRSHRTRATGLVSVLGAAVAVAVCLLGVVPAAEGQAAARQASSSLGVGPQYDAPHVYVQNEKAFVKSWIAMFGGTVSGPLQIDVTPTPSETLSAIVLSPVGTLSVFQFTTPIPYPFGAESIGDMVSNFSAGVSQAVRSGAYLVVSPFDDPVGQDAVVQFPGGIDIQLWRHFSPPSFAPSATVPESRFYLPPDAAAAFIRDFLAFSGGQITVDDPDANGSEIGLPGTTYRKVLITSTFGQTLVLISDGHLPYPFGRDAMGYAVKNLAATLAKAQAAGARILWGPFRDSSVDSAILEFPGSYIAEVHQVIP
jgi:hypothetical protein